MPTLYKTPGVYIEELPVAGPIEAVGTSTAAFVGPALAGPMNKPVKVTSWDQFVATFGKNVETEFGTNRTPYSAFPRRLYMPYAVRGFFDNGGTVCYVVRVGNAVRAGRNLNDRTPTAEGGPGVALRVEALKEGVAGGDITVEVLDQNAATTKLARTSVATTAATVVGSKEISVASLSGIGPGDKVVIGTGTGQETGVIERTLVDKSGASSVNKLLMKNPLAHAHQTGQTVRHAGLLAGDTRLRVEDTRGIERGTVLHIKEGTTPKEEHAEVVHVVQLRADTNDSADKRPGFVTVRAGLANAYPLDSTDVTVKSLEFGLKITGAGGATETYNTLSMSPDHSRFYGRILNGVPLINSRLVEVRAPDDPGSAPPPKNLPAAMATAVALKRANGTDASGTDGAEDNLLALDPSHFDKGINALEKIDDVNILCVPDAATNISNLPPLRSAVQSAMITHCERMFDRVAIIDPSAKLGLTDEPEKGILGQRNSLPGTPRGFAALYYPQIVIQDPQESRRISVPPSGHLAGVYARSDATRGVHKAPANEPIRGALALESELTDAEQGELNIQGVNVLRIFPGTGPVVWGARTLSTDTAWRYISVRRLFLQIEESIQEGTRWAVFEPNNLALWQKIRRNVTAFLNGFWRDGALFGATPEQAFYVKVDEELNPPEVRALGQVIIEIGLVPAFPAEFIVFRIQQMPGGIDVSEL
ncbi:phage tail sheath family protein [bacterium]|nr:phage tail sheath family protein [Chloroflexi bacterium CFX6]RIL12707.1 MAG: phage tail sheath family protein [bacterium]